MKQKHSPQEATYGPLQRKTFRGALTRELKNQIPALGTLTADALAGHIEKMVDEYFPPIERLRMGQILWPAIDEADSRSPTKPPLQRREGRSTALRPADDGEPFALRLLPGRSQFT